MTLGYFRIFRSARREAIHGGKDTRVIEAISLEKNWEKNNGVLQNYPKVLRREKILINASQLMK